VHIEFYYSQIRQAIHSMPSYTHLLLLCGGSLVGGFFVMAFLFKFRVSIHRAVAYPVSALAGTALAATIYLGNAPGLAARTQEVQALTRHFCRDYIDSARYGNIEAPPGPEEIRANAFARNISTMCYRQGVSAHSLQSAFDRLVRYNVVTATPRWHTDFRHMVYGPKSI
jgi:hypothetical protein